MAEVGTAYVSVLASAKGFGRSLESGVAGEVDGSGKTMGSRFGTAFKVGALALMAGGVFAAKFLSGALEEAREAEKVTARTENVIKSMGIASKVSASQIGDLATSLSNKTGVDDDAIQSGQNLLLTFKNIASSAGEAGGVFEQTSGLMVDLSAAMGTDTKGAAIQLGKALNDPVKGLTALTRVGVSFSEQQKKQIEGFVESGQLAKAQGVILGELKNQFGGAAEAMANPADRLKVTYGNLKEQIGTALIPVVDRFLNLLLSAAPAVSSAIAGIGPAFGRIQAFLAPFVAQVQGLFSGGGGGGLISGIVEFARSIGAQLLPVLQTMAATFTGTVLPAITSLVSYVASALFPIFQQVAGIITGQVIPILVSWYSFMAGSIYPAIVKVATAIATNLKPVFDALFQVIQTSVLPTVSKLLAKLREWQPTIQKVIGVVVLIIGKVLEFAAAILGKVLPPVIRFAGFLLSNVIPAVAAVIGVIVKIIGKVIEFGAAVVDRVKDFVKFLQGLRDKFGEALDYVKGIPGKIEGALSGLGSLLLETGKDLIRGLINGIKAMAGAAADAAKSVVKGAIDGAKSLLKIGSPSKVFEEIGMWSMAGFAKGIEDHAPKVLDKLKGLRDALRSQIDQIKSDFATLSSSVASAFTGNLFEATDTQSFLGNLFDTKERLKELKAAFKKLVRWGLSPQFLSQLFASGNGALILDLASSGNRGYALAGSQMFGQVNSLADSLSGSVARNQYGPQLERANRRLERIEAAIKLVGEDVGRHIDRAAGSASRRR